MRYLGDIVQSSKSRNFGESKSYVFFFKRRNFENLNENLDGATIFEWAYISEIFIPEKKIDR